MQVETIRDVLNWTVLLHKNLQECLIHCAKHNEDERARMVLNYLSDHEESLDKIVQGFMNDADKKTLNTWCYDYMEKHPIIKHGHCDSPFKTSDVPHIMNEIVNQHDQVIELYIHLYSRIDIESAKGLLDMIKEAEENALKQIVQSLNRFSDM